MTAATTERRLAALEATISPPPPRRSPVEVAHDLGLELDRWQRDLVLSDWRQAILNCSRQAGKSTVAGLLALTTALYAPGSLTLILSPTERQSGLLFKSIAKSYRALGHPVAADVENRLSLELSNGSAIHALPGREETIRGFSAVSLLIVDEAARVDDALYQSVRPMLAVSGGRILLLSTPFGKRGFYHREWTEGGDDWRRTMVTARDVPRIDPAWLEAERAAVGDWVFNQEYLCQFVETDDQLFPTDLIEGAVSAEVEPLFAWMERSA
ncbi:MAG: terminase large subunit domain-containing protein [Thermomicrobiales bacterium]